MSSGEVDVFHGLASALAALEDFAHCGDGAVYGPLDEDMVARVGRAYELLDGVLADLNTAACEDGWGDDDTEPGAWVDLLDIEPDDLQIGDNL